MLRLSLQYYRLMSEALDALAVRCLSARPEREILDATACILILREWRNGADPTGMDMDAELQEVRYTIVPPLLCAVAVARHKQQPRSS